MLNPRIRCRSCATLWGESGAVLLTLLACLAFAGSRASAEEGAFTDWSSDFPPEVQPLAQATSNASGPPPGCNHPYAILKHDNCWVWMVNENYLVLVTPRDSSQWVTGYEIHDWIQQHNPAFQLYDSSLLEPPQPNASVPPPALAIATVNASNVPGRPAHTEPDLRQPDNRRRCPAPRGSLAIRVVRSTASSAKTGALDTGVCIHASHDSEASTPCSGPCGRLPSPNCGLAGPRPGSACRTSGQVPRGRLLLHLPIKP